MSEIAIRAENLSKRYRIGEREHYTAFRDVLSHALSAPARMFRRRKPQSSNGDATHIWALKDVSFEIHRGEVVGIIGRNGAGKSTLLKILARVTKPTAGYADVHGRMGSLLEVGTGFHPELTGRENTFLNGAILGMSKKEVVRKFDEIVAFAEVEKFIDTPVKHYSSGMYLRLAFSVAAHLETEILIVDEVLAVGDAAFQKKCLGRIGDVAREGRTVLFVSHNMAAITSLCHRVLLIADGKLEMDGSVSKVALHYQANTFVGSFAGTDVRNSPRKGNGKARFASIIIRPLGASGLPLTVIRTGCDLEIELVIECKGDILESNSAIIIYDAMGYRLIDANTAQEGAFLSLTAGRPVQVRYFIRELLLKPGTYFVGLWLGRGGIEEIDNIEFATSFTVAEDPETTKHTEVFPGPYLCRFEVDLGSAYDRTR